MKSDWSETGTELGHFLHLFLKIRLHRVLGTNITFIHSLRTNRILTQFSANYKNTFFAKILAEICLIFFNNQILLGMIIIHL